MSEVLVEARQSAAPLFSIVTATFNSCAMLRRTAQSVAGQSFRDFEWLIVDGGSNDGTVDLIRQLGSLVSHWTSEPDAGIADAWNKGIARASGRYVLILNAGDTYDAGFLQALAPLCDDRRVVCCHARLATGDGKLVGLFKAKPHKLARAMHLPHNWCAVPRHYYRELGLYRKIPLAMDFDWFHRFHLKYGTARFAIIDSAMGTYYLGGTSDARFRESFRANERILVENGANALRARAIRFFYSVKHAIRTHLTKPRLS